MTSYEHGSIEVVALSPVDAENAQAGGADRLLVCALDDAALDGTASEVAYTRSIEPARLSAIIRATDLPVRATLRLSDGLSTQGGEFTRLCGLASDYLSLGAEGVSFGFLTPGLEVDIDVCGHLAAAVDGSPWTFDRAFDHTLDLRQAWRQIRALPGLDSVHTAGSALDLSAGLDSLLGLATSDPEVASMTVAAGGVLAEHVPWLVRAGVTRLHLGVTVRPGGSWSKSHVDAGFVRSWRTLVDDACAQDNRRRTTRVG